MPVASPCSLNAPASRRPTMTNVSGCMGAFSQMFHWNRVLRAGAFNKFLSTAADAESATEKKSEIEPPIVPPFLQQSEQSGAPSLASQPQMGTDLRQILHAKQEPFVLEDVIREKRQPMRSKSSRELKFHVNLETHAPGRTRSGEASTKAKSRSNYKELTVDVDSLGTNFPLCSSDGTSRSSVAAREIVKRSRSPAESMVALPSNHTSNARAGAQIVKMAGFCPSKVASPGKSPVRSPNKKVLLMEAAAKILEGSNQRSSKPRSSTVRSLHKELEGSKHAQELSKTKKQLSHTICMKTDSTEEGEIPSKMQHPLRGESVTTINNHTFEAELNPLNSCEHLAQLMDEKPLVMQHIESTYESAPDEANMLVTGLAHCPNVMQMEVQCHLSEVEVTQEETLTKGLLLVSFDHHDAMLNETKLDLGTLRTDGLLAQDSSLNMSSIDDFLSSSQSNLSRVMSHDGLLLKSAHVDSLGLVKSPTSISRDMDSRDTGIAGDRKPTTLLLLCNYSWWTCHENLASTRDAEQQFSNELCSGCESPAPLGPSVVKLFEGRRDGKDLEDQGHSLSLDYSTCVKEFEQSSPVSVLDPVYEEDGNTFDYFDDARQKLLENVRRFEMLAQMDLDMLMKITEDDYLSQVSDEGEESCDGVNIQASPDYHSSRNAQGYVYSCVGSSFVGSDIAADLCEPSWADKGLRPAALNHSMVDLKGRCKGDNERRSCKVLQSEYLSDDASERREQRRKEGDVLDEEPIAHSLTINALVHRDLCGSNWSNFNQEVEEVEMEVDSILYEILMQELISDLLHQQTLLL